MLLRVENLATRFFLEEGELNAVDDVTFTIDQGESVALVGESGCGKTIVALSILDMVPAPGRILGGRIVLDGTDILRAVPEQLRQIRGREVGMVFQEPGAALNPVYTIGHQITEVLQEHGDMSRQEAEKAVVRLLGETGMAEPEKRAKAYPFELSGGMRQRAVIAMATATRPRLLVADEPTTALDVTVQAEILDLLRHLQEKHKMAILMISHDLGVVAGIAQRVLVMYSGKLVEEASTLELFAAPMHPYTQGLLASVPRLGSGRKKPLKAIPGSVPDFLHLPSGCTFHPRCPVGDQACHSAFPQYTKISESRSCACYKVSPAAGYEQ
jgi:oligopeptide/dipeptide ABC transporter ATP-binding protein